MTYNLQPPKKLYTRNSSRKRVTKIAQHKTADQLLIAQVVEPTENHHFDKTDTDTSHTVLTTCPQLQSLNLDVSDHSTLDNNLVHS